MKKTLIDRIPIELPEEIEKACRGSRIYDSSSSPEARVYFIDREGGFYLKTAPFGTLCREAEMTKYFHSLGLGAEVLNYISSKYDILFTRAISGNDCTSEQYLKNPVRMCDVIAERLRALHENDATRCPVRDRVSEYLALAEKNYITDNYDKSHFPDSFGYSSGEEAFSVLTAGKHLLKNEVLIHGDYCLPNIMLDNWKFTGFIDLGQSGIGDRHIDLFWGRWTIGFNLAQDGRLSESEIKRYGERFLDAYGRDKINTDALSVIAAAEVFG